MRTFIYLFLAALIISIGGGSLSAVAPEEREHFLRLSAVIDLLRNARSAGYSYEDIQNLTFKDNYVSFTAKNAKKMFDLQRTAKISEDILVNIKVIPVDGVVDLYEVLKKLQESLKQRQSDGDEKNYHIARDILEDYRSQESDHLGRITDSNALSLF